MGFLIPTVFEYDLRALFVIKTCRNGQKNFIDFDVGPDRSHLQAIRSTAPVLDQFWEGLCWHEEGFPEAPLGVERVCEIC